MPLAVVCPACHAQFRVPDHFEGQRGKCPKCKATFLATRAAQPRDTPTTASLADDSVDTTAKARGKAIPKPRLLEKIIPPAPSQTPAAEPSAKKLKRAIASDSPTPATPPPAPPKPAPAVAKPNKVGESQQDFAPAINFNSTLGPGAATSRGLKPSESGGAKVYAHRRTRKSKLPTILGVGAVLLLGIAMIGGGIAMSMLNIDPLAALQPSEGQNSAGDGTKPTAASGDSEDVESAAEDTAPVIDAQLADWEKHRLALVTINVIDSGVGTRSGNGFLLPNNLVATTSELFAGVEGAVVTLSDNRRFEVSGVIERPQYGLALLKLDGVHEPLPQLSLGEATPAAGAIVFIGEATTATATPISKRVAITGLPAAMRPALPQAMRDNDPLELIEHQARTAKLADGRVYETPAGAPLLNAQGQIVGVNLALGGSSRKGYAVAVEQLTQLIAASVAGQYRMLPLGGIATADVPGTSPSPLDPPPPIVPPQPTNELESAIADLTKQADALAAKNWKAATAGDYLALAAFAHSVTELTAKIDALDEAQKAIQRPKVEAELTKLADAAWPSEAEATELNNFAIADLPTNDMPGAFVYGRCLLRPEDFGDKTVDGLPLFAFELVGTSGIVVLPIGENGANIAAGSEWLILGTKDMTQSIGITLAGADEAREARIIRSKFLLERPAASAEPEPLVLPLNAAMRDRT